MAIYEILKDAGTVLKEAGKIELYSQILDVQEKLLDMQKSVAELSKENRELRDKLNVRENLVTEGNLYWITKDGKRDGPFCTKCQDSDSKLIRLHISHNTGSHQCPNCKTYARHGQAQVVHIDHWKNSAI